MIRSLKEKKIKMMKTKKIYRNISSFSSSSISLSFRNIFPKDNIKNSCSRLINSITQNVNECVGEDNREKSLIRIVVSRTWLTRGFFHYHMCSSRHF